MRVASNKLKHLAGFYYAELGNLYDSGEIEALLIATVSHVLGYTKTEFLQKREENLNQSDLLKLYDYCKELKKGIPLQYLLGESWFYHLKFKVNPHVLIPRPETEELVEQILKDNPSAGSILDIGTGSGCIPVALKKNLPDASVFACDISYDALSLARENAVLNNTPVHFFESDILIPGESEKIISAPFDVIVSNPPYIKLSEKISMGKNVLEHEPHLALFVEGEDEIVFYKRIIDLCERTLKKGGMLYFELNPLTAESVKEYAFSTNLFKHIELIRDMSASQRFFKALKN